MVRALNGGAVANFTNTQRVAGNNTQFHKTSGADSRMWLSVERDDLYNEVLIGLLQDATEDEDRLYDAVKLKGNPDISFSAVDAETEYAIMAFPPPSTEKTVPLRLDISQSGTYSFTANTMENFEGYDVNFVDAGSGDSQPLIEGQPIDVNLSAGEHISRFYLNFVPNNFSTGIAEQDNTSFTAYMNGEQLIVSLNRTTKATVKVEVVDLQGRIVLSAGQLQTETSSTFSMAGLSRGIYMVRISNDQINLTKKILR